MSTRSETHKGSSTKHKIAAAAIKLLAKHGFAETSFQMIGDELGLSQSAVMYHFPNKNALMEELVRTIIRHNHNTVEELFKLTDDAGQRLLKYCVGNVTWALRSRRQDAQVLILLYYMAGHGRQFSEMFDQMTAGGRQRILAHLLAGQREGLFHFKFDPAAIAELLQHSLFGAMLYAAAAPEGSVKEAELTAKWKKVMIALTDYDGQPIPPRK